MAHGLKHKEIEKIHSILARHPLVKKAILYGSRAMGTHRPGSDIDLTLLGSELKFPELAKIETELDDLLLPYQIDLSIYHQIDNKSLLNHIERVGVVFFDSAKPNADQGSGLKEWDVCVLSSLFDIGSSKRVLKSEWKSEGVPFYRGREITKLAAEGFVNNELFISEEHYAKLSEKYGVPQDGDIVITAIGTIGNSHIVRDSDRFYFKDASVLWMKRQANLLSEYVNYWLKSPLFFDQLDKGNGATVDTLNITKLKSLEIPIPPLSEQEEIVEVLDKAFAAIDQAKANIEQNIANAKELFQSKLNQIFSQKGEGWVETTLEDTCKITSKLCDPREDEYLDLLHVGGANIESKTGTLIELKTAREEGLKSGKFPFDDSMVLYSKIRPYLEKVARPSFGGLCSADIYPLTPNDGDLTRDFLFHLLLTPDFTDYAIEGSGRAGMPKVNRKHLLAYSFFVPPLTEQKDISDQLDTLSESTNQLESHYQTKLASLDELKKSILQKAFAGELTLNSR